MGPVFLPACPLTATLLKHCPCIITLIRCLVLIYEFTVIQFSYRMSKHDDGHNSDCWENTVHLGMHINIIVVASEGCIKMLQ